MQLTCYFFLGFTLIGPTCGQVSLLFKDSEIDGFEYRNYTVDIQVKLPNKKLILDRQVYIRALSSDTRIVEVRNELQKPVLWAAGATFLFSVDLQFKRSGTAHLYVTTLAQIIPKAATDNSTDVCSNKSVTGGTADLQLPPNISVSQTLASGDLDVTVIHRNSLLLFASDILLLVSAGSLSLTVGLGLAPPAVFNNDYLKTLRITLASAFIGLTHIVLPVVAYGLTVGFKSSLGFLDAIGILLWSGCPGGGVSAMWTRFGRTDFTGHQGLAMLSTPLSTVSTPLWMMLFITLDLKDYHLGLSVIKWIVAAIGGCTILQLMGTLIQWKQPDGAPKAARTVFGPTTVIAFIAALVTHIYEFWPTAWLLSGYAALITVVLILLQAVGGLALSIALRLDPPMVRAVFLEACSAHWPLALAIARWGFPAPLCDHVVQVPLAAGVVMIASQAVIVSLYRIIFEIKKSKLNPMRLLDARQQSRSLTYLHTSLPDVETTTATADEPGVVPSVSHTVASRKR